MRFTRPATLILLLLTGLLAGCGGNQIAADEVPVDPPVLTIPADSDFAPGKAASADPSTSTSASASATPTPTTAAGTTSSGTSSGTSGTTGGTSTGGAAATPAATATPGNTGGAGTTDEGLDQFCADNPGAC